jgi:hypothetical protein
MGVAPERQYDAASDQIRLLAVSVFKVQKSSKLVVDLSETARQEILPEILAKAQIIGDDGAKARVIISLLPHLSEDSKREALQCAMAAARSIRNERERALVLQNLGLHLPDLPESSQREILQRVLKEIGRSLNNIDLALSELAPRLSETLLAEALEVARTDEWKRRSILSGLAPHLPETLLRETIKIVQSVEDEADRVSCLWILVPYLSSEASFAEALTITQAIGEELLYSQRALIEHLV